MKNISILFIMVLVVLSVRTIPFSSVTAWSGSIIIHADGTVTPVDAPILRMGNLYVLTRTIDSCGLSSGLKVTRNNVVIDGHGNGLFGSATTEAAGIELNTVQNVTIRNVRIHGFSYGMLFVNSSNTLITENSISGCGIGISSANLIQEYLLTYCSNRILKNIITENEVGIQPLLSGGAIENWVIEDNSIAYNGAGLSYGEGSFWMNNLITRNDVSHNTGFAITFGGYHASGNSNSVVNNTITYNGGGVSFFLCEHNIVSGNTILSNSGIGLSLGEGAVQCTVTHNRIENNQAGIFLSCFKYGEGISSTSNTITNNNIDLNCEYGLFLTGAQNNTIRANNITRNGIGVVLDDTQGNHWESGCAHTVTNTITANRLTGNIRYAIKTINTTGNAIYHNEIELNNSSQIASIFSDNYWDNGYPSGGNCWSAYSDVDICSGPNQNTSGRDGIWDNSYVIDPENEDRYPLVHPWTSTNSS